MEKNGALNLELARALYNFDVNMWEHVGVREPLGAKKEKG